MRDGQWKILKPHLIHTPQYVIFLIHCDSQWLSWLTLPQYGDIIWLSFHMASYQVFVSVISIKHVAFLFPLLKVLLDERQIVFNSAFTDFMIYCQYDLTDYRCLAEEHTHTHTHTHTFLTQINVRHSYFVFPRHSLLGRITTHHSFMDLQKEGRVREGVC